MTDYIDKKALIEALLKEGKHARCEASIDVAALIISAEANSIRIRIENGEFDAKPEPDPITDGFMSVVLPARVTSLEQRVDRLEQGDKPREKPPFCSCPGPCPFYKQKDDPGQYPCIVCGWFARTKK